MVIISLEKVNSFEIILPISTLRGYPTLPLYYSTFNVLIAKMFRQKQNKGKKPPQNNSNSTAAVTTWIFIHHSVIHLTLSSIISLSSYLLCQSGQATVMLPVPVMERDATGTAVDFIAKLLLMPRWDKTRHHFPPLLVLLVPPLLMISNRSGAMCNWPSTGS